MRGVGRSAPNKGVFVIDCLELQLVGVLLGRVKPVTGMF